MIPEEPGIIRATQTLRDNGYQSLRVIYNEYQSLRVIHNGYQSLRVIPNLTLFWGFFPLEKQAAPKGLRSTQ